MIRFNALALALVGLALVSAPASARVAGAQLLAAPTQHTVEAGFEKMGHFKKKKMFFKKPKVGNGTSTSSNGYWGYYVAGAMVCSVGWPMINAAMGNPEPTSEEMAQHVLGCWFPPYAIVQFLQNQNAN